jgi:hypothetical protein
METTLLKIIFFWVVLIKNGKGIQSINYNKYRYSKGSIFYYLL